MHLCANYYTWNRFYFSISLDLMVERIDVQAISIVFMVYNKNNFQLFFFYLTSHNYRVLCENLIQFISI